MGNMNEAQNIFWDLVDQTKMTEKYRIDKNLQYLKVAPLNVLKNIFIQYRFFTHYYISDLGILISKMPFGKLKSILAEILNDELGNGKSKAAHPILYDNFLRSLGIKNEELQYESPTCMPYLLSVQNSLNKNSWAYGVGLRGMGGECLCQIYLSTMHEYFSKNPEIEKIKQNLEWEFWDIHIGEIDLHHQTIVKNAISEIILEYPDFTKDLFDGYIESKTAWDEFWSQIFKSAIPFGRENERRSYASQLIISTSA